MTEDLEQLPDEDAGGRGCLTVTPQSSSSCHVGHRTHPLHYAPVHHTAMLRSRTCLRTALGGSTVCLYVHTLRRLHSAGMLAALPD
jgi:hypothetical protein